MFLRNRLSSAILEKMDFLIAPLRPTQIMSHDREILERTILPYLASTCQSVLFVGCAKYTKGYNKLFERQEYWTIDCMESRAKYGSKRHIRGDITQLSRHFEKNYLDVIIMNGVLGWGVDTDEEISRALEECRIVLKPGGLLILGWNDFIPIFSKRLGEILSSNQGFRAFDFPGLNTSEYHSIGRGHVFSFLRKPA